MYVRTYPARILPPSASSVFLAGFTRLIEWSRHLPRVKCNCRSTPLGPIGTTSYSLIVPSIQVLEYLCTMSARETTSPCCTVLSAAKFLSLFVSDLLFPISARILLLLIREL